MHIEAFREYCLAKKGVTETFPFDENTLVFKVMNKMFALTNVTWEDFSVNLKCDPDWAEELRASYADIYPGYHMSKKHWNTVVMEGEVEFALLKKMINHSYDLVVSKMTKKDREALEEL